MRSTDAAVDADLDGGSTCTPQVPDPMVLEPGEATGRELLLLTSSGEVAVFFTPGAGQSARTWEGGPWTTHEVYPPFSSGFSWDAAGEIEGRPLRFDTHTDTTSDSGKPRYWLQLADGSFSAGETITSFDDGNVHQARVLGGILAAVGVRMDGVVLYLARSTTGTWTVTPVDAPSTSSEFFRVGGLGTLSDGTEFVVTGGTNGMELHRRIGIDFSEHRPLLPGPIWDLFVAAPPDGNPAPFAVVAYRDNASGFVRGAFIDLATGEIQGAVDLISMDVSTVSFEVAFAPDGSGGLILIAQQFGAAWIARFEGTSLATAEELRPDLQFDVAPHLIHHPCGGSMILHQTRDPIEPLDSTPRVLEPLRDFWPGHDL